MNIIDKCAEGQEFPFKSKLSFTNLIGYWQVRTNDPNKFKALSAREVVKQIEAHPEFTKPMDDLSAVHENPDLVELIFSAILPPTMEDEMVAVHIPFSKEQVYATPAYQNIMNLAGSYEALLVEMDMKEMIAQKLMNAYALIMQMYYGVSITSDRYFLYTLVDPKTKLKKHYRIEVDPKFCEIILKGDLPELSDADIKHLIDNLNNLDEWTKYLPPHLFEFQGLLVFRLRDETKDEILSRIKDDLLKKDSIVDATGFDALETRLRSLLQLSDLKLGIAAYQRSSNSFMNFGQRIIRSILMGNEEGIGCTVTNSSLYDWFVQNPEPMAIDDLTKSTKMGGYEQKLIGDGLNSLILGPLFYNNEFVGLLELGTPNAGDLNTLALAKVKEVLPLFAVAVKRSTEELETKIQSIIKEKYTSIHPTVEWKFEEAANDVLAQEKEGKNPVPKPIVFNDVYPLYAASDIRNSSIERNRAINTDLKEQLTLARKVLKKAYELKELPILEETIFRLDKFHRVLKRKLISGDEVTILEFLQKEVEPIIKNLEQNIPGFKKETKKYLESLDAELGVVYKARKNFEDSLTKINEITSTVLDEEEVKAQEMFPHFFEKYKTDGVEHNIYVGASLSEKLEFDEVYLRNLRLWQLMVTAEVARKTAYMIPELPLPLETTHLILVHSAPLSIRFRMDEKKFDVDGAYNIRYEIIKKRIDKSLVKDSDERITQPGKIAIIYSQDKDAQEYMKYIDYLKSKDLLEGEVENLELEELQGVSGLKALRIAVKIQKSSIMKEVENILQTA